jgi:hypothetical protein
VIAALLVGIVGIGVAFAVQQTYEGCACIVRRADAVDDAEEERYEDPALFAAGGVGTVTATVTTLDAAPRRVRQAASASCTSFTTSC